MPSFRPSLGTAFLFLSLFSLGLGAQGIYWSRDQVRVREEARRTGRAILVLVEKPGAPDPYAQTTQGLGPGPLTDWAARVYLPLRVSGSSALALGGWRLKRSEVSLPSLLVLNPLGEERGRVEGLVGWQTVREFLRAWTVVPLKSAAPTQRFLGTLELYGDGEGGWTFSQGGPYGKFLEFGTSGPFLILRGTDEEWEVALPLQGRSAFWRHVETEVWERAFFGGFE